MYLPTLPKCRVINCHQDPGSGAQTWSILLVGEAWTETSLTTCDWSPDTMSKYLSPNTRSNHVHGILGSLPLYIFLASCHQKRAWPSRNWVCLPPRSHAFWIGADVNYRRRSLQAQCRRRWPLGRVLDQKWNWSPSEVLAYKFTDAVAEAARWCFSSPNSWLRSKPWRSLKEIPSDLEVPVRTNGSYSGPKPDKA